MMNALHNSIRLSANRRMVSKKQVAIATQRALESFLDTAVCANGRKCACDECVEARRLLDAANDAANDASRAAIDFNEAKALFT